MGPNSAHNRWGIRLSHRRNVWIRTGILWKKNREPRTPEKNGVLGENIQSLWASRHFHLRVDSSTRRLVIHSTWNSKIQILQGIHSDNHRKISHDIYYRIFWQNSRRNYSSPFW